MKPITVLALVVAVALVGCNKKAAPQSSAGEVAVTEKPAGDLAPESSTQAPPPTPASEQPTRVVALAPSAERPAEPPPRSARTIPPAPPPATPAPAPSKKYVVQRGDTLWSIARKTYGDPKRSKDIALANHITDPNRIHIGQVLTIP